MKKDKDYTKKEKNELIIIIAWKHESNNWDVIAI